MKRGFTLIELLIVITIIGILAVALLPSVLGAPARARDAQRKADLNTIIKAIESYYADNQKYPDNDTSRYVTNGGLCFGTGGHKTLDKYFSGEKAPGDPLGSKAKGFGICDAGQYYYCKGNSKDFNYYVLSYMEIPADGEILSTSHNTCPNIGWPLATADTKTDSGAFRLYYIQR